MMKSTTHYDRICTNLNRITQIVSDAFNDIRVLTVEEFLEIKGLQQYLPYALTYYGEAIQNEQAAPVALGDGLVTSEEAQRG